MDTCLYTVINHINLCGKVVIVTYIIYCFVIEDMITSCRAVPGQEGKKEKQACKESKEHKKGS